MNQNLLRTIKKMQEEMVTTQQEIESTIFYASAGGVVNVEVKGTKELIKVTIENSFQAESTDDLEILGEMVVAACNQAYQEIDKTIKEKMGKYNDMLGSFGGLF
ncbi:MAG: YbaB/EbfC family nucleoid-associated protein [Bacilli bacterium]|nr:YbaB/EbfC family nucleoid-associated protein [Bacilli bacterium]MDD4076943.1 YbaB/EbfC family nucleoid-associated protein [Bacilli bacterium]MDD4387653.1 YbaB/EbfC family nucleoid-associated protein [Bacilli bacterium]